MSKEGVSVGTLRMLTCRVWPDGPGALHMDLSSCGDFRSHSACGVFWPETHSFCKLYENQCKWIKADLYWTVALCPFVVCIHFVTIIGCKWVKADGLFGLFLEARYSGSMVGHCRPNSEIVFHLKIGFKPGSRAWQTMTQYEVAPLELIVDEILSWAPTW